MVFSKLLFPCFLLLLGQIACATPQYRLFDKTGKIYPELNEWAKERPRQGFFVVGEYHYQPDIQAVTAEIFSALAERELAGAQPLFAWEFLNFHEQTKIQSEWMRVLKGEIRAQEFLKKFFPVRNEQTYLPILEKMAQQRASLQGLNLARKYKKVVTQKGIDALEEKWKPQNLGIGGAEYFSRFKVALGGHVDSEKLQRYFEAQCLTDSWMAFNLYRHGEGKMVMALMGSFHSDYGHGTVSRLKKLTSEEVVTLKLIAVDNFSPMTLEKYFRDDNQYGTLADYLMFVKTDLE